MFQYVGANDVIEVPGQGRQAVIQIGAGKLNGRRMRRIGPIDAGDLEAAVRQNLPKDIPPRSLRPARAGLPHGAGNSASSSPWLLYRAALNL